VRSGRALACRRMTVLSCIGHWYTQMLYAVPFLGIAGFVGWDRFKHRDQRRARASRGSDALRAGPSRR
jgi:hypothetical protein